MGKKGKVGKARKDRFYHLAKETGYRSRAAFKLIQLNRKFEFLQKSNVIIDLCAAPGGWLQVVAENAPMSNHIIGIDLVPIPPIKNVTTLEEDITTEKCRQALKKQMHTAKADLVLNDGAPNVGTNWVNDAYQQVELTLHALKLATEFLKKGGWFVTKIFRSKDYDSLMWVFQQLFKNVHATKPQASRNESAEIFVVCQSFIAPDRIDPKFLNPKYVFKEVNEETKLAIDLVHPSKRHRHRDGYPEGDYTLFNSLSVTKFLASTDYMNLLATSSEIKFDSEEIENHPLTTTEIKECFKDIKLLGKSEIKNVFKWRTKLKNALGQTDTTPSANEQTEADTQEKEGDDEEEDELATEEKEIAELERILEEKNMQELRDMKKAKKKVKKAQMKQKSRIDAKMVIPGDRIDVEGDQSVFDMKRIRNKKQLSAIEEGDLSVLDGTDMFEEESDEDLLPKRVSYERGEKKYIGPGADSDEEEEMEEEPSFEDMEEGDDDQQDDSDEDDDSNTNPLLVDMGVRERVMKDKADTWFSKSVFEDLEREADEDIELVQMGMEGDAKKRRTKKEKEQPALSENLAKIHSDEESSQDEDSGEEDSGVDSKEQDDEEDDDDDNNEEDDDSTSEDDSDYDYMEANNLKKDKDKSGDTADKKVTKFDGIEVVPVTPDTDLQLNEEGLALGAAMVQSRKRKRDIIDSGYHRYMFDDVGLPDWFEKDEKKHTQRKMPISKAEMEEYKMKSKAIDAAPIKKIAEAKARKKKRMLKSLEKARKKANNISDNVDVSEKEKWNQIKHVYKKAGLLKKAKEKVTYVKAKKGAGKKVHRPAGVKGKFKVVDGRLKKDVKSQQKADMRKQKNSTQRRKQHNAKANKRVRR